MRNWSHRAEDTMHMTLLRSCAFSVGRPVWYWVVLNLISPQPQRM